MSHSILEQLIELQTETNEPAWMPGLPTLRTQQSQLVDLLRRGFTNRRDVLFWSHAVAVMSLGHIEDQWFNELLGDRYRVGALLSDQADRDDLCTHPPDDAAAEFIRDDLQQKRLSRAFQSARAEMRAQGADFTETEGQNDPGSQRFIAMRPRVHQIAVAQHNALHQAFGGFDSRRGVLDWADYVDYATTGYLPDGFPGDVTSPMSDWWQVLTGESQGAWLESRLAETVLPAANRALRDAMLSGTEEPQTEGHLEVVDG